ncbi:MAG: hypothetical protein U1G08_21465 [Verrucomicrobiota bacterium]
MREIFTGPLIKTELLVVWLEKHGISATSEFVDPGQADPDDLSREVRVSVRDEDYDQAHRLFFEERQDEL